MNALLTTSCDPNNLMPGGAPTPAVVLFWRSSRDDAAEMCAKFAKKSWPRGYRSCSVDLDSAPELRAWFNIGDSAALAIVQQGVLLAYELSCDETSCRRLVEVAEQQLSLLANEL